VAVSGERVTGWLGAAEDSGRTLVVLCDEKAPAFGVGDLLEVGPPPEVRAECTFCGAINGPQMGNPQAADRWLCVTQYLCGEGADPFAGLQPGDRVELRLIRRKETDEGPSQ
jgi:hypothetical protein